VLVVGTIQLMGVAMTIDSTSKRMDGAVDDGTGAGAFNVVQFEIAETLVEAAETSGCRNAPVRERR